MADNIEVADLVARISFDDTGLNKSMAEIDRQMKLVKTEFDKASSSLKSYGTEEEKLKAKSQGLTQQLQLQQQKVDRLNEEFQKSVREKGADARETQNLAAKLNQAQTAYNNLESELKDVNEELEAQQKAAEIANSEWSKLGKSLDAAGKKLQAAGKKMSDVGKQLSMKVTAPILAAGGAALAAANDFDKAFGTIRKGTGATGDDLEALKDNFREVFKVVPESADAVATAIADVNTRTGLTGKALEDLASQFLMLGRVSGQEVPSLIASGTRAFGDWGIAVEDQAAVLDHFWKVSQSTGIGVDQLMQKVVQFGAPLRQMGFSFETSTALLGKFEKEGVNAELVMGSLRIALGKMAREGISAEEGLQTAIDAIEKAGDASEANALAMELFGSRAGPDMAAAIREGRFEVEELISSIAKSPETIGQAAADTQTLGEKFAILKNNAQLALEPIGTILLDLANKWLPPVIAKVQQVAEWFRNLSGPVQNAIIAIGGIVAAIGPVLVVVGALASSIGSIISFFGTLSAAIGAAGGASAAFGAVIAAITGPIGIAVAAIVGITAALTVLYQKNETVRQFIDETWTKIKDSLQQAWQAILDFVIPLVEDMAAFFKEIFGELEAFWEEHGAAIMAIVEPWLKGLVGYFKFQFEAIKTVINVVWGVIKTTVRLTWNAIKLVISNALDVIFGIIDVAMKLFKGDWKGAWDSVKETVSNIWGNIETFLKGIDLKQIGKDIMQGLINGIKSMAGVVADTAKDVANSIGKGIKDVLGINSPSKVTTQLGVWTGEGLAIGMDKTTRLVAQQAAKLSAAAVPNISPTNIGGAAATTRQAAAGAAAMMEPYPTTVNVPVYLDGKLVAIATNKPQADLMRLSGRGLGMA